MNQRSPTPLIGMAIVALCMLVFLVDAAPRATSEFGDSVESVNAATWLIAGRSIFEDGPLQSKLGAESPELGTYAHHPPGVVAAASVAVGADSTDPLLLRSAAVISSLATIVLLWYLLKHLGLSMAGRTVGMAFVVGSPVFLFFGSMLNMEALSIPWALGLLLLWIRRETVSPVLAGIVAGVTVLTSWQGVLLAGIVSLFCLVEARRGDNRRFAVAVMFGSGLALVVSAAWLVWANGDVMTVFDAAERRREAGLVDSLDGSGGQMYWIRRGFASWTILLGVAGVVIGLRSRRIRPVLAAVTIVAGVFALAFPQGAAEHAYWNMWLLLPIGVGAAVLADQVIEQASRIAPLRLLQATVAATAVVSLLVVAGWTTVYERNFWAGVDGGELVASTTYPADQEVAYFFYGDEWSTWLSWHTELPTELVYTSAELRDVASEHGEHLVLVRRRWPLHTGAAWTAVRSVAERSTPAYAMVTAGAMVELAEDHADTAVSAVS